jgi:diadenosine tetraphosphate (Ap4A) HIT family hydrolase
VSSWRNPEAWDAMVSGTDCPICRAFDTSTPVAMLEVSWVMADEHGPMPGYCWVPLRRHAVELHELSRDEAGAYMRDLQSVARAVQAVTGAVKLNYEIHGNTVPHLHTHIFPRHRGDRFEGGPIDPRAVTEPVYRPGEFEYFRAQLQARLAHPVS